MKSIRRKKAPRPISELASGVMSPIIARRASVSMELLAAWPELVGPDRAELTRPERIRWPRRASETEPFEPGTLVVACDGGIALRLQHEADILIERVNVFLGFRAVARLKIVQRPVSSLKKPARPETSRELDPGQLRRLREALSGVDDPGLRERLEKLGRGVMSRDRTRK